jgi:hypothetical protein
MHFLLLLTADLGQITNLFEMTLMDLDGSGGDTIIWLFCKERDM